MKVLRTPDERFANLVDFPYEPRYVEVDDYDGGSLRMAYVDEGPAEARPVVLIHGEPTWGLPVPQDDAGPARRWVARAGA